MAPNVLIFLLDDVGAEVMHGFSATAVARTPRIDALGAEGVRFQRAYSAPVCSPTRAELMTGRWSHRYGMTAAIVYWQGGGLGLEETILPEALAPAGYTSALVGKWHLSSVETGGPMHALDSGFDHHRGSVGNLWTDGSPTQEELGYTNWDKVTDGTVERVTRYATTECADDAIELMQTLEPPWMITVAFQAAHEPFEVPPAGLYTGAVDPSAPMPDRYFAIVEAMDTEIGRILDALEPQRDHTWVVLTGDNGTPAPAVPDPAKKTAYENGVRVPLIVAGPGLDRPDRDAEDLIAVADLMPTVLDLAGAGVPTGLDGVSHAAVLRDADAAPARSTVYAGYSYPAYSDSPTRFSRMVRDDRYKLIEAMDVGQPPRKELYDLGSDEHEGPDLLAAGPLDAQAQTAFLQLNAILLTTLGAR